jgi:hypothetical protein
MRIDSGKGKKKTTKRGKATNGKTEFRSLRTLVMQ